jgi:hypothetical protein
MIQKIRYVWHVIAKLFSFALFGSFSLLVAVFGFPIMHVFAGFSEKRFKTIARKLNHLFFIIYIKIISFIGCIRVSVENKEALANLRSKVVIANHPSILDVVILFSLVPNADCIVKGDIVQSQQTETAQQHVFAGLCAFREKRRRLHVRLKQCVGELRPSFDRRLANLRGEHNLAANGHNRHHDAVYVKGHPIVFRGKVCDAVPLCERINQLFEFHVISPFYDRP